ncbi:hypothetical protein [Caldifermentibacillus hisashii]|uniref:hypothetical protein n=1 Tax=Caldifermentibacillus hisashii TaxID=996558 RepID=UPI00336815EB
MRAESERYYHVIQSMRFSKRGNLICLSWDGISQRKENEEQLYIWHLQTSREFQVNAKECLVSKSFDYMDRNGIRYAILIEIGYSPFNGRLNKRIVTLIPRNLLKD